MYVPIRLDSEQGMFLMLLSCWSIVSLLLDLVRTRFHDPGVDLEKPRKMSFISLFPKNYWFESPTIQPQRPMVCQLAPPHPHVKCWCDGTAPQYIWSAEIK